MSDIDTLYDHLIEQQFITSPKPMLKLDLRIPFDYNSEELKKNIALVNEPLRMIKENSTLAVDDDLVDNYEFALLYLSLLVNDLEEKVNTQADDFEKAKTKKIDEILEKYAESPDIVKSTGEVKPLSEEAIKRQLRQLCVEEDNQNAVNKNMINKLNKDIKAYIRRGDRMWSKLIQRNVDDKRNREQWLIQ